VKTARLRSSISTKIDEKQVDTLGLTHRERPLYSAGFAASGLPDLANAPVAELVDALDSKSSSARSAGSIPARGTMHKTPAITITYAIGVIPDFFATP
jgi:hypothetical protein